MIVTLDQALAATEASGDSRARLRLTDHLRWIGRLPEAIELLEATLRDDPDDEYAAENYGFEYEADELAAQGLSGVDTGWLREELDMPVMSVDD